MDKVGPIKKSIGTLLHEFIANLQRTMDVAVKRKEILMELYLQMNVVNLTNY